MAKFEISWGKLRMELGGYVDRGGAGLGESYCGIQRRFFPRLKLWSTIEKLRSESGSLKQLDFDTRVQRNIKRFYKEKFWERVGAGAIHDEKLANELFWCSVSLGLRRTVRLLQQSLNRLIEHIKVKDELWITGVLDDLTWRYLRMVLERPGLTETLRKEFIDQRTIFDHESGERNPSSEGRVFISYSRKDIVEAERLSTLLKHESWEVWRDVVMMPGQSLKENIYRELESSHCVIVIWSKHSRESEWVIDEAGKALDRGVLVPVRIDSSTPPGKFNDILAEDFFAWDGDRYESSVRRLLESMKKLV